jgi:hypothetical protein
MLKASERLILSKVRNTKVTKSQDSLNQMADATTAA